MEFTGERVVPDQMQKHNMVHIFQEHLIRYVLAMGYAKGMKKVVDVGCGAGYGTKILSFVCENILGIDKDEESIKYATDYQKRDNSDYRMWDIYDDNLSDKEKFNVIIAFEFVEHVEQDAFWKFVEKHLDKDGILIVSTPISIGGQDVKPVNPFHLFEWSVGEFIDVFDNRFEKCEFYFQKGVVFLTKEIDNPVYGIAICKGLKSDNK
jgi:2-polyprenyl-3-methyl-5-hydroxy-6-metoxy-1,4-benzoquinol methylase